MIQYIGNGDEFITGIPARDLTPDEWLALTDEQRLVAVDSKLYEAPDKTGRKGAVNNGR